MSNTPVQHGETLLIGIGSNTYSAHIVHNADTEAQAEEEIIRGEENETTTVLISDRADELTLQGVCKATSTIGAVKKGDVVTVNSIAYRVLTRSFMRSALAARFRLGLRKEVSMTYTA